MNQLDVLTKEEVFKRIGERIFPYQKNYLAMFSSWYGGIVTDPAFMLIPIDDHMVHRGDGIFEAFKCVDGKIYLLDRHLDRLERSAKAVKLDIPCSRSELIDVVKRTIIAGKEKNCLIRVFVSRGPGGFTTKPSESIGAQLYVVITRLPEYPEDWYSAGVSVKTSSIPMKPSYFAGIKSCNYLPNVLMSAEAEEAGVNYTVAVDEHGNIGEGPTENIGVITADYAFLVPRFDKVLRGTTVTRMMELAQELVKSKVLGYVGEADVRVEDVLRAQEVMMFGTTFDVLPVVFFNGRRIGNGQPGPFFTKFLKMLRQDMKDNPAVTTEVWT
ncbi:aminotransferase class IV [Thermodesulforhabdus norvegica]|uniref:Branched-chain amino acid aminotransferase n=1 Tax=Thermodesulforhabdus norvegica TaxID=39841 RepID=A0A1I4U6M1_9BACT|nr:aminotransferase class IV [Thermodesulforhabdus norvegica]SFM84343.1 branched-chain amino acid aminotransferase [Thermodesulforhabdus norvegica]